MIRSVIVVLAVGIYILICAPIAIGITWLFGTHHFLYNVGRTGARLALFLAGGRLTVVGKEKLQGHHNYVFMPNHTSNIDPIVAFLSIPHDVKAIAKKEFFRIPLLSTACRMERFIAVDRKHHESAVRSIETAIQQLMAGDSFLIYPEGTRSKTGQLGEFRKGGFIAAIRSGVPIVPITLNGCHEIMPKGSARIRPGRITAIIHDPVEADEYPLDQRDDLIEKVRAIIISGLDPSPTSEVQKVNCPETNQRSVNGM